MEPDGRPLGSGMNKGVAALAVSGNNLYVGGSFTTAGGKVFGYIARAYLPFSQRFRLFAPASVRQSPGDRLTPPISLWNKRPH
jgi:hypothetical protein